MRLIAYNPSTEGLEKSYLSNSYPAGSTELVVKNTNNVSTGDKVLLGDMGREKSEIVTVDTVDADNVTITLTAGTLFPHSSDDPVYALRYNTIRFHRSTTGVGGSYTFLASVPIDVDNADKATYYNDDGGLSSYYYEVSFYNTASAVESSLSDPMPGSGYDRRQVGSIINEFFTEVGDLGQVYMSVPQALGIMNECNDDLTTQSGKPYRFLKTSATLTPTADTATISIPSAVLAIDRVRYNYVYGITDRSDNIRVVDIEELEYIKYDNTALSSDNLQFIALDESANTLVLYPTPDTTQTNKIRLYYWKKFTDFDGLGNTIETPTPRAYKLFLCERFYRMRALHDESFLPLADRYGRDYSSEVVKLQRLNRLDKGSPRSMKPDVLTARGLRK